MSFPFRDRPALPGLLAALAVPFGAVAAIAGVVAAPAPAQGSLCDFIPMQREVILNTDFTTINTTCGPINVTGGVFVLRNVRIPAGVTVQGTGSRPMIWIVTGDFQVDGKLSVRGGDGARVDTLNSANFPSAGGIGHCAGGTGGRGSPDANDRSLTGENGFAPGSALGLGGKGGLLSCVPECNRGSGGGGGVLSTAGDPHYPPNVSDVQRWQQVLGRGGNGCLSRALPGGEPGVSPFIDARSDNDFFGVGADLNRGLFIVGELPRPLGGQGGGGGGDRAQRCSLNDPNFIVDNKGGGGGAGGGVLIVFALGRIIVGPQGWICADGGHGGGGEQAGSNNQGGGGGGGSGGMVVALSHTGIVLHAHGETYGNNDYSFAISADGGIGTQGRFGGLEIANKYPPGSPTWNAKPTGGFGGMGIVELIAPFGANTDATNTILDDGISIVRNGVPLTGGEKQRYIAWRGYPNGGGVMVDDFGNPTNIGDNEGDIRPAPILLPLLR